jgi:hypothetical protein
MLSEFVQVQNKYNRDKTPSELKTQCKQKIKEFIRGNPELSSFLKKKRVEGRFIKNILQQKVINPYCRGENSERISRFVDLSFASSSPINSGFTWDNSPEGFDFWCTLNTEIEDNRREEWRKRHNIK